jgi:hypothetical protein
VERLKREVNREKAARLKGGRRQVRLCKLCASHSATELALWNGARETHNATGQRVDDE